MKFISQPGLSGTAEAAIEPCNEAPGMTVKTLMHYRDAVPLWRE